MNRILTTILLTATLASCDNNTPIGTKDNAECDCIGIQQNKDINGDWIRTPYSIDVRGDWCILDGDTSYYLEGMHRTIITCK